MVETLNVKVTRDSIQLEAKIIFFVGLTTSKQVRGDTALMISYYDKHLFCNYPGRLIVIWLINKANWMDNSSYLAILIYQLVRWILVNLVILRGFARHLRWPGLAVLKIELKMWRRPLFVKVNKKSISYLAISYLYTLLRCFLRKIVFTWRYLSADTCFGLILGLISTM